MVKSAFARHQANKRVKKYQKEIHQAMLEMVGFGRNFKKDPWDCGNPQCFVCHHDPKGKSNLAKIRKERLTERELLDEI